MKIARKVLVNALLVAGFATASGAILAHPGGGHGPQARGASAGQCPMAQGSTQGQPGSTAGTGCPAMGNDHAGMGRGMMHGGMGRGGMHGGMGRGGMQAPVGQGGMHGSMGPGAGAAGQPLMSDAERQAMRERMRNATTPEERREIASNMRAEVHKRATERGTVPQGPQRGRGPAATQAAPSLSTD